MHSTLYSHLTLLVLISHTLSGVESKSQRSLLCRYLQLLLTSSVLGPDDLHSTQFSNTQLNVLTFDSIRSSIRSDSTRKQLSVLVYRNVNRTYIFSITFVTFEHSSLLGCSTVSCHQGDITCKRAEKYKEVFLLQQLLLGPPDPHTPLWSSETSVKSYQQCRATGERGSRYNL